MSLTPSKSARLLLDTGILKINSSCHAYTKALALTTRNVYKSKVSIVYMPKVEAKYDFKINIPNFHIPELKSSLVITNNDQIKNLGQRIENLKLIENFSSTTERHRKVTYSLFAVITAGLFLHFVVPIMRRLIVVVIQHVIILYLNVICIILLFQLSYI